MPTINSLARALTTALCGTQYYNPTAYTCYNTTNPPTLCPNLNGIPYPPCGTACYDPSRYTCTNTPVAPSLALLPPAPAPFTLTSQSTNPSLHNLPLSACQNNFVLGRPDPACNYCLNSPPLYVCSEYKNQTVFVPDGRMGTKVPGGQYWFVDVVYGTGRLKYAAPGKAANPVEINEAGKGVSVYQNGLFLYEGGIDSWLACPTAQTEGQYYLYRPTASPWNVADCQPVRLVAKENTDPNAGAYSYQ